MDKNTKILIVGRTGSGKSTIENYLFEKYGLTGIKSYATRPQRGPEDDGHIFISDEEAKQYKDLATFTEINGYKYFSTEEQLQENDVYVIDVIGIERLLEKYPSYNYIILHVTAPYEVRKERTSSRINFNFEDRQISEDKQFKNIEDKEYVQQLLSSPQLRSALLEEIINTDFEKTKEQLDKIFNY